MAQTKNIPPFKAVLFDLDGTLVDHFNVIYRCYCHALRELGLEPVSYEKVKASVGGSIVVTFGKLIHQAQVEDGVRLFREEFDRIWHEDIGILEGVEWLLQSLHERGLRLAVFTNKEGARARKLLQHIGMDKCLDGIYGTLDTPWKKPEPEFTRHVLEQLGASPSECCMIGDSPYDVDAAASGPMPCYTVATGSHSMEELSQTAAAGVYPDMWTLGQEVFGLTIPDKADCHSRQANA